MPVDMILTNNSNIKIKEVKQARKIIIECEDDILIFLYLLSIHPN